MKRALTRECKIILKKAPGMRNQHGFTVIELICVIVVLGAIAISLAPSLPADDETVHLDRAAYQLASAIRLTQELSMSKGADRVSGDPGGSFVIDLSIPGATAYLIGWWPLNTLNDQWREYQLHDNISVDAGQKIRFNQYGEPVDFNNRSAPVNTGIVIRLRALTITRELEILPFTGKVVF